MRRLSSGWMAVTFLVVATRADVAPVAFQDAVATDSLLAVNVAVGPPVLHVPTVGRK